MTYTVHVPTFSLSKKKIKTGILNCVHVALANQIFSVKVLSE